MSIFTPQRFLKRLGQALILLIGFTSICSGQTPANTYWWNDAVFYEVFVRSFKDSDGDGKGDFKGLIEKLDYLNDGDPSTHTDLGVTGIWLMPIQQSPSYHGYDVTDYRTVEQDYGTNEDFKTFMKEAHKRGIKVIIDYVMNHTSSQHPWFRASAISDPGKRNWYVWQDVKPTTLGPWGQTVWFPKNFSNYYALFWEGMPDLNYNTKEVKDEMFDIARFWLEDMNVDGFRLDAVKYLKESGGVMEDSPETISFFKEFRAYYRSVKADAFAVGEAWSSTAKVAPYVNDKGLDYCFEFDLANAIIGAAKDGNTSGLQDQMEKVVQAYPASQYGTFLTNHDINRVMDKLGNSVAMNKVAADLLLTLPGIPYIYYGEEIGMNGSKPDENIRTPMHWNNESQAGFSMGNTPWRAVNTDYKTKNVGSQQNDPASLWSRYKKLISLRNGQAALRKGSYKSVETSAYYVFSFLRQFENENIIVVTNTGYSDAFESNVKLTLADAKITPGNYTLVELQSGAKVPMVIDNNGGFVKFNISKVPAQSTLIYKLMSSSATSSKVNFQVNMKDMIKAGTFNPATESVDISASFNSFGATVTTLKDDDADGIYTYSSSTMEIGTKITYKYRINAKNDGREEFVNSSYLREYIVPEGESTVKNNYQTQVSTGVKSIVVHPVTAVYPIPASKELNIEYSKDNTGTMHYHIADLIGVNRISSSFEANASGQQSLSCEGLTSGTYLLTVEFKGISKTYKVVVQK